MLRLIGFTLSLLMLFSVFMNGVVFAEEPIDWSDEPNRDTTWVDGAISTPQQLAQFAYIVNSGKYAGENKVWLTNDIDLAGKNWIAIGKANIKENTYTGFFNGNGFTVSNMTYGDNKLDAELFWGLFGLTTAEITSVNVTGEVLIDTPAFPSRFYIGGIAGYLIDGSIKYCNSGVNINISADVLSASYVAGISSANQNGYIVGCKNTGNISIKKGNSSPIAGITAINIGTVDRCENYGTISGYTTFLGGIVGNCFSDEADVPAYVTNCYNAGKIEGIDTTVNLYYGGVVAQLSSNAIMKNCFNVGEIVGAQISGALIGYYYLNNTTVENVFYLEASCEKGVGRLTNGAEDTSVVKTSTELKSSSFFELLNVDNAFVQNADGFPSLAPPVVTVALSASPKNATFEIMQGDRKFSPDSEGNYNLALGEYVVTVTAENYATKTETINVTLNENSHKFSVELDILFADYSGVELALAKIPGDLGVYTDKSVDALDAAIAAVVQGKDITQQNVVDGYAAAIEDAIKGLTKKTATTISSASSTSTSGNTTSGNTTSGNTTSGNTTSGTKTPPKTGGTSTAVLLMSALLSALFVLVFAFVIKRKKSTGN